MIPKLFLHQHVETSTFQQLLSGLLRADNRGVQGQRMNPNVASPAGEISQHLLNELAQNYVSHGSLMMDLNDLPCWNIHVPLTLNFSNFLDLLIVLLQYWFMVKYL